MQRSNYALRFNLSVDQSMRGVIDCTRSAMFLPYAQYDIIFKTNNRVVCSFGFLRDQLTIVHRIANLLLLLPIGYADYAIQFTRHFFRSATKPILVATQQGNIDLSSPIVTVG